MVQRLFTRKLFFRCNLGSLEYPDRLLFLKLKSLSSRRHVADMVLTYKIVNGLVDVDVDDFLWTYTNHLRGPSVKIKRDISKNNRSHNFFSNRASATWNNLPSHLTVMKSLPLFKSGVSAILSCSWWTCSSYLVHLFIYFYLLPYLLFVLVCYVRSVGLWRVSGSKDAIVESTGQIFLPTA